MCESKAEGGRRCAAAERHRSKTATEFAPEPRSDDVDDVLWRNDDLSHLWRDYSHREVAAGLDLLERYRSDEVRITDTMQSVAKNSGTQLEGTASRVKAPASLIRKIRKGVDESEDREDLGGPVTPEDEAQSLNDVVRYTVVGASHKRLADTAGVVRAELENQGYVIRATKNFYRDKNPTYRGLHYIVESPHGTPFEVQVHSRRSSRAKQESHPHYEVARNPQRHSADEVNHAVSEIRRIARAVPKPHGIDQV